MVLKALVSGFSLPGKSWCKYSHALAVRSHIPGMLVLEWSLFMRNFNMEILSQFKVHVHVHVVPEKFIIGLNGLIQHMKEKRLSGLVVTAVYCCQDSQHKAKRSRCLQGILLIKTQTCISYQKKSTLQFTCAGWAVGRKRITFMFQWWVFCFLIIHLAHLITAHKQV